MQIIDAVNQSKISRNKSPKRKNKSVDTIKLKNNNVGQVGVRNKLGASFESIKKSTGELFNQMHPSFKKDKENKESLFLKKKKMVYAYLKSWSYFVFCR